MFKCRRSATAALVLLVAVLAPASRAAVSVDNCTEGAKVAVAAGSPWYLVAWCEPADGNVFAARVSEDLVVSGPSVILANNMASCPHKPAVSWDGTRFLVAWAGELLGLNRLECAFVDALGVPSDWRFVASGGPVRNYPCCAFCANPTGQCYLIVWEEKLPGLTSPALYGATVSPGANVSNPFLIAVGMEGGMMYPSVASDGQRFFVVWNETSPAFNGIRGCFVHVDRVVEPSIPVCGVTADGVPDIAFDATSGTYAVVFGTTGTGVLMGQTCLVAGTPLGGPFVVDQGGLAVPPFPRVAAGQGHYVTVWEDNASPNHHVLWRGASPSGPVGDKCQVCPSQFGQKQCDVASDGEPFIAVWLENTVTGYQIFADTISFWQHFYTPSNFATGLNNSRHLALDPATGRLHMVYESDGGIYYSYSNDQGTHWWPQEYVGAGTCPCVVCEGQGVNPVWVGYKVDDGQGINIMVAARTALGQWTTFDVFPRGGDANAGPAMSICHEVSYPVQEPSVYIVYGECHDQVSRVHFDRVSFPGGKHPLEHHVVAEAPVGRYVGFPSVATTPGDIVHVTWEDTPVPNEIPDIFYTQRLHVVWSQETEPVSVPGVGNQLPNIEAFGDSAHVVWCKGWFPSSDNEIWKRSRVADRRTWRDPQNRSNTPSALSTYPQQSSHWATAWQEGFSSTADIWANVYGSTGPIAPDPYSSLFVNTVAEYYPIGPEPELFIDYLWTNEVPGGQPRPFEAKFLRTQYATDGGLDLAYYDCGIGESTRTRYCSVRDGYARWRDFDVDFGWESLGYILPFLNPNYDYVLRLVLFQASGDTWEQSVAFNGVPGALLSIPPQRAETVFLDVPRESYQRYCRIAVDLRRLKGRYAAIAGMTVYQCYPFMHPGGGGEMDAKVTMAPVRAKIDRCGPSPFLRATSIVFSVPSSQDINLSVYDVQGRLVRVLAAGTQPAGAHSVSWDGKNDVGTRVPAGAYFCRLKAPGSAETSKLVLTK